MTKTDFFTSDYVFSYEESNLNFAAAFTAYDNVREPITDPSIGQLQFSVWSWGPNE